MSYDVHVEPIPTDLAGKLVGFYYTSAVGVRGAQKLINRWVRILLTPKGTDPADLRAGTYFTNLIGSNVTDPDDLLDAAALAVEDCNSQVMAQDRANFAASEERLESAAITHIVERARDTYDIYVTIRNVAGEQATLTLPRGV